jgi:syntaxin-binding protein 1
VWVFSILAALDTVLQDHVSGRLDQQAFPYVKDSPTNLTSSSSLRSSPASPTTPTSGSLRSAKPNWHKAAPKTGTTAEIRQRVLVFVAGGMTYSEMREAYLLSKSLNKDIIIGEQRGVVSVLAPTQRCPQARLMPSPQNTSWRI